jgi:hypothetical protein
MLLASSFDTSNYFRAADITAEKKFRIKNVAAEDVGTGKDKERKLVVHFTNDERGLVLNRTNNRTLRGAFGDDTAGWINKIIVLFPTTAEVRGDLKPAIRVRIPPPKGGNGQAAKTAPASTPPLAAEIDPSDIDSDVDPDLHDEIVI